MRVNVRLQFGSLTFYAMLSHTQRLKGITSRLSKTKDQHVILWDLETYKNGDYEDVRYELVQIQRKHSLSNIYVVSDKPESSWRALCFTVVSFRVLLQILLETLSCDYSYIWWTMKRGEATHRISQKTNRPKQKLFDVIESYYQPIPPEFPARIVNYETGIQKKGLLLTNVR